MVAGLAGLVCLAGSSAAVADERRPRLQARAVESPAASEIVGPLGRRAVFIAERSRRGQGREARHPGLWVTDGSDDGTKQLKAFRREGAAIYGDYEPYDPYDPYAPTEPRPRLVFAADDGIHGIEWWTTDGTPEGTHILIDAMPGPESGVDVYDVPVSLEGGAVVLPISDPEHGREWWRTDGTSKGTELIADINPGSENSHFAIIGSVDRLPAGDLMYFTAYRGSEEPVELWRTDGTSAGTFSLGLEMTGGGLDGGALGDALVFGDRYGALQTELWTTDGTVAGTAPYYDFAGYPGASPVPFGFAETLGHLFLNRNNILWAISSVDAPPRPLRRFQVLFGDGGMPNRSQFGTPTGPALIFDAGYGEFPELTTRKWVSLGTSETTVPLASVVPGSPGAVASTGERALLSDRVRSRARLLSTTGSRKSLRRISIERGIERLGVVDPTEARGRVYFIGSAEAKDGRSEGIWKISRRR